MTPKHNPDPSNSNNANMDDADLQEISAVDTQMDELSIALDQFEQQTNNMIEQLKQLLHSNREIRQELALENAAAAAEQMKIKDSEEETRPDDVPEQ